MTRTSAALAAVAALVALAGCSSDPTRGYSFNSTYSQNVRTVFVPVFRNHTFHPGIEVALTEAVIKEIQRSTPWVVVGSDQADTTLAGVVVANNLQALSVGSDTGLVEEMAVELAVEFAWTDNRTGQPLVTRSNFRALESFVPAIGTGERIELGENAAVQEMARAIVAELRSNW